MTDKPTPTEPAKPSFYIGVGASAGGLEALQVLFSHLPTDLGVAYIVVQHLSPDFRSMMPELLAKSTTLPLVTVSDGMAVAADTIYLLPPRKTMTISDGVIQAISDEDHEGLRLPIDIFFRSLAEDQQQKSIAIVLSGTGSDGSRGLQAVKEAGGLVVVQQPEDAKFDGMPYSAVNTGLADIIATAEGIAQAIASYTSHPILSDETRSLQKQVSSRDSTMQEIFDLLLREAGIDFSVYKSSTVSRRIEQRMGIKQLETLNDYRRMLTVDREEVQTLGRDLLIGVTRFFRDAAAFEMLRAEVIPKLLEKTADGEAVRVWVAGCSTGEEAYTVAMLLREAVDDSDRKLSVKVFATDVDPDAIVRASAGRYPDSISGDVSPERLLRHFTREDDSYVVNPKLRGDIVFAVHNIIKDPPFSNLNLCVCRNLLIYFQPATQRRVLQSLHFSLNLDGVLFLGGAETLGDVARYFAPVNEHFKIYRRSSKAKLPISHELTDRRDSPEPTSGYAMPSVNKLLRHHRDGPESTTLYRAVVDELLDVFVPPSVVIGEDHEIVHVYGDISPYTTKLRSGHFRPTIESLIHEDLSIAFSTALVKAANTESDVLYKNIAIREDDELQSVDLRVGFVKERPSNTGYFLVTFYEAAGTATREGIQYDEHTMSAQRIADLESELKRQQAHLQVTVEELETTNEELQTSNEELMAANEELQSTNEELQSVNEELYTVNSEYQEKIVELSRLNADLQNTISATDMGIIFLDEALVVREFTPRATDYFNLVRADIGRPFSHISHDLIHETLEDDIRRVERNGKAIDREVSAISGDILLLKVQPYTMADQSTEGLVLSMTTLRHTSQRENELRDAYAELRATVGVAMLTDRRDYRLLIVDDEESERQLFRSVVSQIRGPERFVIEEASTPAQALELLRTQSPDVVFVDQRLGGDTTGLALVEEVHREGFRQPSILLSGYLDDSLNRDALAMGVYDCLDKADMTPPLLQRCIRYAVRHARTERYLSEAGWEGQLAEGDGARP